MFKNSAEDITWDHALDALADIANPPRAVLSWASANWEEASSRLIGRLRDFAIGRRDEVSGPEAFYLVHLCGEKRALRAYPIICRLIAEDAGIADWLDDAVTETLPGVLINVYDGDPVPLRKAIESERGDEFARASALAALGYLVRAKAAMSDDDMRAYLRRIRREAPPRSESVFWLTWAATVANLGYEDMRAEVAALRYEGLIPEQDFDREAFDARLALAMSDAAGLAGFKEDLIAPLNDAASALCLLAGAEAAAGARRLRDIVRLRIVRRV
jgi:hypothetical protein